jgi:hypothetical protein
LSWRRLHDDGDSGDDDGVGCVATMTVTAADDDVDNIDEDNNEDDNIDDNEGEDDQRPGDDGRRR